MANFCVSCGGALTPGAGFCNRCGARVGQAAQAAPVQPPAPPIATPAPVSAAPKSGSVLKVLLVCFLLFCVIGIASVVGLYYYAKNKVHEKMVELKERTGVDLPAAIDGASRPRASRRTGQSACMVLTGDEAQSILGMTIVRAIAAGDGSSDEQCSYFTDATSRGAAANQTAADFDELSKKKSTKPGDASEIENLVKNLSAGVADGSVPILQVTVFRGNAKIATTAFNIGNGLMGGKSQPVEGPWDEAVFGPMNSTLTIRKGDNGAMIDLRQVAHGRDRGLQLAKVIAGRL